MHRGGCWVLLPASSEVWEMAWAKSPLPHCFCLCQMEITHPSWAWCGSREWARCCLWLLAGGRWCLQRWAELRQGFVGPRSPHWWSEGQERCSTGLCLFSACCSTCSFCNSASVPQTCTSVSNWLYLVQGRALRACPGQSVWRWEEKQKGNHVRLAGRDWEQLQPTSQLADGTCLCTSLNGLWKWVYGLLAQTHNWRRSDEKGVKPSQGVERLSLFPSYIHAHFVGLSGGSTIDQEWFQIQQV